MMMACETQPGAVGRSPASSLFGQRLSGDELYQLQAPAGCFPSALSVVALDSPVQVSGNAVIEGKVLLLEGATVKASGNARLLGGVVEDATDLSGLMALAAEREAHALSLAPTQHFAALAESAVIHGTDGVNVIELDQGITLAGEAALTLRGSEAAIFIFNVPGEIRISGRASILLSRGVKAENVLFNNYGEGPQLLITGQGSVSGTFLARKREVSIVGSGELSGLIASGRLVRVSGNGEVLRPAGFCIAPAPTPTPTETPSPTPTPTPTETPSPTPTSTPTETPSPTPTPTPTPTETVSPSPTPSPTPTDDIDPSPSPSPSPCVGPTCGGGVIGI
ncbi:MAG: hypothetical protein NDJ90_04270 [Oligoflexia bacterium]|nr:hypothetical protein [Oligoflexia bacterium]